MVDGRQKLLLHFTYWHFDSRSAQRGTKNLTQAESRPRKTKQDGEERAKDSPKTYILLQSSNI